MEDGKVEDNRRAKKMKGNSTTSYVPDRLRKDIFVIYVYIHAYKGEQNKKKSDFTGKTFSNKVKR